MNCVLFKMKVKRVESPCKPRPLKSKKEEKQQKLSFHSGRKKGKMKIKTAKTREEKMKK